MVLEVNRKQVVVPREVVELAAERPMLWTVVARDLGESTGEQTDGPALGPLYGVCPNCLTRAPVTRAQVELRCPGCDLTFAVDWG